MNYFGSNAGYKRLQSPSHAILPPLPNSNNVQFVEIQEAKSTQGLVTRGVSQGSILGPLLFVVYINDLCCSIIENVFLCADDSTLYASSRSGQDLQAGLNRSIENAQGWFKGSQLVLNSDKTKCVLFEAKTGHARVEEALWEI